MKKFIGTLIIFIIAAGLVLSFEAYTTTDTKVKIFVKETTGSQGQASSSGKAKAYVKQTIGSQDNTSSPEADSNNWALMLVNSENPIPDTYTPELESLPDGLKFDKRAIDQLNAMLSDARAEGLSPVVCSAYRTIEYQSQLFDKQVKKLMSKGLNRKRAETEARKAVAYPGTSEHHTGLAVDIVALSYQLLDEKQGETAVIKWITAHCSEYGFILRYPEDKADITGIIHEPWHFRYVGLDAAKAITESGDCLEEYLERINNSIS